MKYVLSARGDDAEINRQVCGDLRRNGYRAACERLFKVRRKKAEETLKDLESH